jgi:hypothetical protein
MKGMLSTMAFTNEEMSSIIGKAVLEMMSKEGLEITWKVRKGDI